MQDLANNIGFVVVGVALLLLSAAVRLRGRMARPNDDRAASALALPAAVPPTVPTDLAPAAHTAPAPSVQTSAPVPPAADVPSVAAAVSATVPAAAKTTGPAWALADPEALLIGSGLALLAVALAAWLWDAPDALLLPWLLLGAGAAFAVVARVGLGWPREAESLLTPSPPLHTPPPISSPLAPLSTASVSRASAGSLPAPEAVVRADCSGVAGRAGLLLTPRVLLVGAVLAELVCLTFFAVGRLRSLAWLLHALAVVLVLAGLSRRSQPAERRLLPGWARVDTLTLGGLVLAALAVRLWNLSTIPEGLWFDEAQRGLEALRILTELGYRPIFAAGTLQEPTGLWYLMAPLLAVFGRDALALRLPVAIAGAVGVGAIYLLAGVLYGRRVALVAAALAVTLTWHLNFSRIALPAVVSLTCDTLAVALLVAGLRSGSRLWLGAAGVMAAAGLFFYFTSQLLPPVLAVIVLHQWYTGRSDFLRRCGWGLATCALAFVLTAGPLLLYAVTRPNEFAARANAVTVFRDVEQARSLAPLIANVRAHLLMFQVRGDNNGRHNWSGRPMLDPLTGGLSVAGLGLALAAGAGLSTVLLLAWLPIALVGGILSSIWDAPQSHRSIDALVPVVILAALPLGLLWGRAERILRAGAARMPEPQYGSAARAPAAEPGAAGRLGSVVRADNWLRFLPTALVVGVLVLGGAGNLARFFGQQQADARTWEGFMPAQSAAGRILNGLPAGVPAYLEPQWFNHPSVRFLDAGAHEHRPFEPGASLPVTDVSAAILIGARPGMAEYTTAMYPGSSRAITRAPDGSIVGYAFLLSPEVVASTRGVQAVYRGADGRIVERREESLSQTWANGAPVAVPVDATWTTTLLVPQFGTYRLRLEGPPSLALSLDGLEVVRGGGEAAMRLARGNHALRLTGTDLGTQPVTLSWSPSGREFQPIPAQFLNVAPVEAVGLHARVYAGNQPQGEPSSEQIDPNIELRTHLLPLPRPYTLEWSGAVRADQTGRYRLGLSSLGASALWIDGVRIFEKPVPEGVAEADVQLTRGWHDVRVRFVDAADFSYITLLWQPPGGARAVLPPSALRPWPAARVPAARPADAILP